MCHAMNNECKQNDSDSPPAGRYTENHGVIHNMWFNTTTGKKQPYYQTQFVNEWWDNGTLPIWITAQRQVCAARLPAWSETAVQENSSLD